MAENPFEVIEGRLDKIEDLILNLQHSQILHNENFTRDVGGIEIAVEETGLSSHSIYRLVSERKLPHSKRGGRLYFSRKAIRKWIIDGDRTTV